MTDWIFLSKNKQDQYINMFAKGCGVAVTDTENFCFESSSCPIVLRGILKYKIMHRCWQEKRDFYYMDSGYLGNQVNSKNPNGWKLWHRIVKNDLQHGGIVPRPSDRLSRLDFSMPKRRLGRKIIVALPDDKPCKFYGISRVDWAEHVIRSLRSHTDRPIILRERDPSRTNRVVQDPLNRVLRDDVHALVTFNSAAAIESIMEGVPAFVLSPSHAAAPVSNVDLSQIESPYWPEDDKLYTWACHLAYGQFHVSELRDGTAFRILNEN